MSPYLLLGFLMAGILSVFIPAEFVEKHLGGGGFIEAVKASAIGVPIPLCSCGVLPVAASLRKHGAGKGASISFLVSTPQTGVDSILVTYGLLGPIFAVFRVIAAFVSGILCGVAVNVFDKDSDNAIKDEDHEDCCGAGAKKKNIFYRIFNHGFIVLPKDIAKALIFGLIMSGIIGAVIPENYFAGSFGNGIISMLAMMVVGIPLYVCSTASVPIALAFIKAGLSPGAALVFLITGPVSNAASLAAIGKMLGKKTLIIYLLTICIFALIAGLALNSLDISSQVSKFAQQHHMKQGWIGPVSTIILLAVLLNSIFTDFIKTRKSPPDSFAVGAKVLKLRVNGMTCQHCAESATRALEAMDCVEKAEVFLNDGIILVYGDPVPDKSIEALKKLDFEASVDEENKG
jgi:uncharacterized membrane protein YraQ (UPF0718 family)/copper chaperone CopZ